MEELFTEDCAYYLSIGMTWEQYWYGDVWMAGVFREADKRRTERVNAEAHLMGMYIYEALCDVSPVLHAFAKKGTRPKPYRTEPYGMSGSSKEKDDRQEEAERLRAEIYMKQMMRAGKNWGKRGGSDGR